MNKIEIMRKIRDLNVRVRDVTDKMGQAADAAAPYMTGDCEDTDEAAAAAVIAHDRYQDLQAEALALQAELILAMGELGGGGSGPVEAADDQN